MDFNFLAQTDQAALNLELARAALEAAKTSFEQAKQTYDELLGKSEEHGIPKAKLKKLTEDRLQGLIESGLAALAKSDGARSESKRARKAKAEAPTETWNPESEEAELAEISFLSSRKEASEAHA